VVGVPDLIDTVALIVQETSAEVIEPRFSALTSGDVRSKAPGELVTIADEEAEELLTKRLGGVLPGVPVVGEEACAGEPTLVDALGGERAWLVDPLDGTANFVAGSRRNAVRFAEVTGGSQCAGVDYPGIADGEQDFVLFWRTLPWDHAPGALLAEEAGATVRRLDSSPYQPTQTPVGLLVAADDESWEVARGILE